MDLPFPGLNSPSTFTTSTGIPYFTSTGTQSMYYNSSNIFQNDITTQTVNQCAEECDKMPGCNAFHLDGSPAVNCKLKTIQNFSPGAQDTTRSTMYFKHVLNSKPALKINRVTKSSTEPSIWFNKDNGTYYYLNTDSTGIILRGVVANDISEGMFNFDENDNSATKTKIVLFSFTELKNTFGSSISTIRGPTITVIDNTFYILFSMSTTSDDANMKMYYTINSTSDVFNKSLWSTPILISYPSWAVDPFVFRLDANRYYLLFSSKQFGNQIPTVNNPQKILISRITIDNTSKRFSLVGLVRSISTPNRFPNQYQQSQMLNWEPTINSAPCVIVNNNRLFLVYSTSFYTDSKSSLGMLELSNISNDPTSERNWIKRQISVFSSSIPGNMNGIGHCSFTKSGSKNYIIFHAKVDPSTDYSVYAKEFIFDTQGIPFFGGPLYKP